MALYDYYFTLQKNHQQRTFSQLLVIIVVTNTINVKNNMNMLIHEEIEVIPFLKGAADLHD